MRSAGLTWVVISAVAVLTGAALPAAAGAVTFPVTKLGDTADGFCDADCSLREAVIAANGTAGADVISLPAGTLVPSIVGQGEQAAATGDLDVLAAGGTITVRGAGAPSTVIDPDRLDRVFEVLAGARLELSDVTISDGTGNGSAVLVGSDGTGASLDITRSAMTLHRDGGPAVYADNDATVTISDSAFRDNGAESPAPTTFGGSGLFLNDSSTAAVARTAFTGNRASFGGAGIFVNNAAQLTLGQGTFIGNTADFGGGALWTQNDSKSTVTDSTFTENSAGFGGGAVFNQNSAVLTISGSTLAANNALDTSAGGGAIFNQNQAKLTITGSTIAGNTAESSLGGGAIFSQNQSTLDIGSSTISGNRHIPDPVPTGADRGGGAIYAQNQSLITLTNTTVSGNRTEVNGGAFSIANRPGCALRTSPSPATPRRGWAASSTTGRSRFRGSPRWCWRTRSRRATSRPACRAAARGPPCRRAWSLGNNVEPTASCGLPRRGHDGRPQLGPLAANGGATLRTRSHPPARRRTRPTPRRCPATDQRGVARPQLSGCDIGAFELRRPAAAPPAAATTRRRPRPSRPRSPSRRSCDCRRRGSASAGGRSASACACPRAWSSARRDPRQRQARARDQARTHHRPGGPAQPAEGPVQGEHSHQTGGRPHDLRNAHLPHLRRQAQGVRKPRV